MILLLPVFGPEGETTGVWGRRTVDAGRFSLAVWVFIV